MAYVVNGTKPINSNVFLSGSSDETQTPDDTTPAIEEGALPPDNAEQQSRPPPYKIKETEPERVEGRTEEIKKSGGGRKVGEMLGKVVGDVVGSKVGVGRDGSAAGEIDGLREGQREGANEGREDGMAEGTQVGVTDG